MKKTLSLMLLVIFVLTCTMLAACSGGVVADNTEYYDEITKTLKLTKSFEGKSFLVDGIGSAKLDANTDGDTTRFKLPDGSIISVRYQSIDTPESTGDVEKWGKAATVFVKSKLKYDTEIVLENLVPGEQDSYRSRYMGYVWYKNAEDEDYKLLNLEVVENGFSENKSVHTSEYPYWEYFNQANEFAKKIKLRLYSDLDDPLYSKDPIPTTIKEFWENTDAFYNADTDAGSKIQVYAYLTDCVISKTETHTYIAVQYDPETGKTYTLNVYCGYQSNTASSMEVGHLYRVVGTVQNFYGKFQLSGIAYDSVYGPSNPLCTTPTQLNGYLHFNSEKDYNSRYRTCLYTDLTVVSAKAEGDDLVITATAQQKTKQGVKDDVITFTVTVKGAAANVSNIAEGKLITTAGFQFETDSHNITVLNYSDLTVTEAPSNDA